MVIEVRDYDESWPLAADAACRELMAAAPDVFVAIEHIGSTAVPGLAAKPIIDLMASTGSLDVVPEREADLERLGYRPDDTGMSNRLFYRRSSSGVPTHHLHVVTADTWESRNERLLRDHLRAHPAHVQRYAALKQRLATSSKDEDAYTRAKTDLIQELVDAARTARGLPLVPVWED
jgi:GrpB-like predicted nucleotidyltransferase (UPF0157 family)